MGPEKHASSWMLFPENIGPYLSMDETSLSQGELYTIVTNKEATGKKGALVAMVKGTVRKAGIAVLHGIPEDLRDQVKEIEGFPLLQSVII